MKSRFHQNPIPHVDHVHLYVLNLQKSKAFYQDILGFKILKESEKSVELTADGKHRLITIEQPEGVKPVGSRMAGLYHFAILLPSRKDLVKFLRHLVQKQAGIQGASDHGFSEAIYFADPDGNGIEVYADKPESEWLYNSDGSINGITTYLDVDGLAALLDAEEFEGMPKDTIMGHLHLHVSDLSKADEFFQSGLGMDLVMKYGAQASFYSFGNYHHHIAANTWNRATMNHESLSSGLTSYSVRYYDAYKLEKTVERLVKLGYLVQKTDAYYLTKDSSGNNVKLYIAF